MSRSVTVAAFLAFTLGSALQVEAGCQWEWLCDAAGKCEHGPVCNSATDLPPPEPPSVHPIVSPAVPPLMLPGQPALGTTRCHEVQRCPGHGLGGCYWDVLCN
jgi:hypothetical protein